MAISRVKPAKCSVGEAEDAAPPPRPPPGRPPRAPPRGNGDPPPPPRRNRRRRRPREDDAVPCPDPLQDPPTPPPLTPPPPSPMQRPRWGRARRLESSDEEAQAEAFHFPCSPVRLVPNPPDSQIRDTTPEWTQPAWFDANADQDFPPPSPVPDPQPEARAATPPPLPPPPQRQRKRKPGNPNWVKGGSFAGSHTRPRPDLSAVYAHLGHPYPRPRPDVSALSALISEHLGISSTSSDPSAPHLCTAECDVQE